MLRHLSGTALLVILLAASGSLAAKGKGGAAKNKAAAKNRIVELETSLGKIRLELFSEKAPRTVANFLRYVRSGHYKGTIFHRVISNFMVQGGGMTPKMKEKRTFKPIRNEADNGLSNDRGTVAMARTPNPHSASAQFFINVKDNHGLNHSGKTAAGWGYCVFGKVKKGMDVVDKIRVVSTTSRAGNDDVPVVPVLIKNAKLLR